MINKKDRFKGCLVGLAVGDSLGAPIEWKKEFRPVRGMRINKRQIAGSKKAGHHTDDTAMALALADSLITQGKFDAKDQLEKYCDWMDNGTYSSNGKCEGIGRTTRNALNVFKVCGHLKTKVYDVNLAGNGSIMRLAPIPMFYSNRKGSQEAQIQSMKSSVTTHVHEDCVDACNVFGKMIYDALNGYTKGEMFCFSDWQIAGMTPEIANIITNKTYLKEPPYIQGSGHVIKSLEAALWAFNNSTSFKHGVLLAVNLGQDSDTTAAIYGQLAGAYYGYNAIPKKWRDTLIKRKQIEGFALKLYRLANRRCNKEI